ncbi:hypothetical protein [Halobacterium sp. CBA1126]|uniref:hypothetical protein n=1 Tax=Halobacterium sp. CBA1126 TaxID=2668074 RepID=UPI0012FC0080|nr:hypothetical protein [Halobacterium sp. CBA1126]MUV59974.1 hypothetical protein [Halobacterium sp. CBA1126]
MTDFTIESGIRIPDREKREAKRDLEQSIGDVTIDVDAAQGGPGSSGSTASLAGGAGALDELGDQTDILHDIHQELEKIGTSGGFGGGSESSGGLLDGTSGVAIGSALTGGGGGLAASVLGGASLGTAGIAGLGIGGSAFLADQYVGEDAEGVKENVSSGLPGMVEHTVGSRIDWEPPEWQGLSGMWENVDLSPPDDLWGVDLSPPNDLWGVDLSPPQDLWGVDLSPPDDLWGFDLSPPDGFWSGILPGSGGGGGTNDPSWGDAPGDSTDQPQSANTPGSQQKSSRLGATYGDYDPSQGPSQTSGASAYDSGDRAWRASQRKDTIRDRQQSGSTSGSETRVDVQVQEIRAQIESGRALEDAIRGEMDSIAPDIKHEVLTQLREEMPSRL